jgi:hypothetical protein
MTPPVAARKSTPVLPAARWERIAIFVFGVVFLGVLLYIATSQNLTGRAYEIVRIVIALAAAGIGSAIPGFLHVRINGAIRASGALALFVVVYFFSPPPAPVDPAPVEPANLSVPDPETSPDQAVTSWFSLIDLWRYESSWQSGAQAMKSALPLNNFVQVYEAQHRGLGAVIRRTPYGISKAVELPNGQRGNFRIFTYLTDYSSGARYFEMLVLMAEQGDWKVLSHQVSPHSIPMAAPANNVP